MHRAHNGPGRPLPAVVIAGIPAADDCPILRRVAAFLVPQGVPATLEHVFRGRDGVPADLDGWLAAQASESVSAGVAAALGIAVLRIKEWLATGLGDLNDPIWTVAAWAEDASRGVLRATLPAAAVERPGIYELGWAVVDGAGVPVAVSPALLSVERSLFGGTILETASVVQAGGPPTIGEIRGYIMDNDPNENTLLDDVEFSDSQICLAIAQPIRWWNDALPPLRPETTRTFRYRGAWLSGIAGQLHLMAANHYRRNNLKSQAGGVAVMDKDKEREYMAEGMRLWQEYTAWVERKKVSINMRGYVGTVVSPYSFRTGW